ncbi:hypothetical protein AKJ44_02315 [candidate division MSBL1 archaeon SCGC-AAA261F17]|uniref:Tyr recombinase domain-containing protein n=1 Tax=candidate division MSBL1 archaeon SCGC-AAA261F17 TaxID=1698274 RepID=A0A133V5C3_9EURY|nr:hypothetical protein AKJ44_02315 [candidate division MSBL1 archaeon SCGC-AAA261F17]
MIESKEDLRKIMKDVKISSQAGRDFLDKYDKPTRSQYESCLKSYLAYRRGKGSSKTDCDDLKEEAKKDWEKGKREREFVPEGMFSNYRKKMRDLGYSAHTIANVETCLCAFYKFHQYPLNTDRFTKMRRQNQNTFKRINREEVGRLYNATTSKRNKALLLFLYQTGQAVKQIVDLKYGDVKKELEEGKEPLMIQYPGRKGRGSGYVTFLGSDGVHALKKYLNEREKKFGRKLKYDDVLFASQKDPEDGITQASVASMMSYLAVKSGLVEEEDLKHERNPYRPHAFRHNFKSQLATKCSNFVIEYMMGHEIGVEKEYFLADFDGKEGLREYYAKNMEPELSVQTTSMEKKAVISRRFADEREGKLRELVGEEIEEMSERWKDKWLDERLERRALEEKISEIEHNVEETIEDGIGEMMVEKLTGDPEFMRVFEEKIVEQARKIVSQEWPEEEQH